MVEFIDNPRNRKRSRGKSRPNRPAKRQRQHHPPPEYITISDDDEPTNSIPSHQNTQATSCRSQCGLHSRGNGRPSANSSKDPILAEVDRLIAEYTRGIPPHLRASGKKKAYYVIWRGRKCGIFTDWAESQAQTKGFSKAGYVGTQDFPAAVKRLRAELTNQLRQAAPQRQEYNATELGRHMTQAAAPMRQDYAPPPPYSATAFDHWSGPPLPGNAPYCPTVSHAPVYSGPTLPLPDNSQNHLPIPYPPVYNGSHFPTPAFHAALATNAGRLGATAVGAPIKQEIQPCPPLQYTAAPDSASNTLPQRLASNNGYTAPAPNAPSANVGLRNLTAGEIESPKAEQADRGLAVPPEKPTEPPLCPEQQHATDLAMQGHNVFITGSGGCGKSVLVKALNRAFCARFHRSGKGVHLIAPTGQAALNIEGKTTFNYAGWTPDDLKKPLHKYGTNDNSLVRKAQGKKVWLRYTRTQVLIIDEISMIENQFFERLSHVMSATRKDTRPFGGVQVIVVGDFCQLPPVDPFQWCMECGKGMRKLGASSVCPNGHGVEFEAEDKWAFKAPAWARCNFKTVHLTKIHRQQDEAFIGVLQKCRLGRFLETDDVNLLLNHETETENATELKATREEVATRNRQKFGQIPGQIREYHAIDQTKRVPGELSDPPRNLDEHRYARTLELKANMPVVLLANVDLDSGLCNGRQGTVIGFVPSTAVRAPNPPNRGSFQQDVDGYRAAETRYDQICEFLALASKNGDKFPLVHFAHGVRRVIGPDCSVIAFGDTSPYSHLSRCQIPLAQGWAMTIHKSQSLSLDRVTVDLSKVFERGQAYVAVSRARSLRGLKIEGVTAAQLRSSFQVDYAVQRFMETFEAADVEDNPAGTQEDDESFEGDQTVTESSEGEEEADEISQEEEEVDDGSEGEEEVDDGSEGEEEVNGSSGEEEEVDGSSGEEEEVDESSGGEEQLTEISQEEFVSFHQEAESPGQVPACLDAKGSAR